MKCILEALENEGDGVNSGFWLDLQDERWCRAIPWKKRRLTGKHKVRSEFMDVSD